LNPACKHGPTAPPPTFACHRRKQNDKICRVRHRLLGRHRLEHGILIGNNRLPLGLILGIDFGRDGPVLGTVEQDGVDNVFGTHVGLVVIDVGCAVRAVIAVDGIP